MHWSLFSLELKDLMLLDHHLLRLPLQCDAKLFWNHEGKMDSGFHLLITKKATALPRTIGRVPLSHRHLLSSSQFSAKNLLPHIFGLKTVICLSVFVLLPEK
jgi:hypothetical protein